MKRWAILTILLYIFCLSVLIVPLFVLLGYKGFTYSDTIPSFYIYFLPSFVLVQVILLLVPIDNIRERPIKRRKIIVSAVVVAFLMMVLTSCFFSFIILMIWGEETAYDICTLPILIIPATFWLIWGIVFFKSYSDQEPLSFTSQITKWLLRGSILELLVAVPSHILSRHKEECCAPPLSLFGIATGLSIGLMSFGPGVFLLFASRIRDKKIKQLH